MSKLKAACLAIAAAGMMLAAAPAEARPYGHYGDGYGYGGGPYRHHYGYGGYRHHYGFGGDHHGFYGRGYGYRRHYGYGPRFGYGPHHFRHGFYRGY